ncbi:acetyl/propionyl/methylcrotonyl-CoA carboxylase subunit alpha [Phaeobacter gallaeciensis]|uniref:acetyl/propionyl/methylcrotonyl-CoA carboxylase subunit alpha n=1 Tax=Phaeobacter gallaeciensis TaxID=60890 RepID=UPI00237F6C3F|nr:acetyl-CoA carboxylase biotin carboxylase subunit [Phaeobacter gallaeciensis]MDE4096929.1 acetyl-CoA carboxylase biotin carboxylase subunit [Phaeobacter gallaeciensis]MDE4105777.1 acetyl-CoA carboxylase biotin carboxylase subunit [Phaeobacter gallaeciensis]MDE4110196.1 acetyl-CoA carboxylase biotin carboxylase subunit [Phaeobacter gallaeciensis]MDE4114664.1 acetyl-CoA carboxylase biotin carboxylase subunit [Phaeobacter gallaeciensis]MDE4119170.1 acetyl-CoA carboxylase biotin carboxylase sub
MTQITSLLVANRGEIALRIMTTARAMGITCIAVHTEADAGSPHVAFADRAICIGAGPVGDSYLAAEKLIEAAREAGVDAVHPGYGFLSESAEFASACMDAGLIFIGPGAEAIALMGNKAAAKRRMIAAGVPCVPGYEGEDQSADVLEAEAARIGYPVMIKAAAGGGGRGMRLVEAPAEFTGALGLAQSEALSAFGSDEVILEKAVIRPRHVEIQVFADSQGNTIHLGERDCSVQRRHQKVVEEAPSPALDEDLRARMGAAAVEAARAIGYVGAGTVEFLLDDSGAFYFLEMNTRLQVEHPVTEMVTGLDLVALQIRVAAGQPLGVAQEDVTLTGHAIEVRLYAEDPAQDFLPQAGRIAQWQPPDGTGIRVDAGIASGQEVSPYYDPMLAKLIAHGASRAEALERLIGALKDLALFGPASNRDFLLRVLNHPEFAEGKATTGFIADHLPEDLTAPLGSAEVALAAALIYRSDQAAAARASGVAPELLGWSAQGALQSRMKIAAGEAVHDLRLSETGGVLTVAGGEWSHQVTGLDSALRVDGTRADLRHTHMEGDRLFLATGARIFEVSRIRAGASAAAGEADGQITAPMHGALLEVCVAAGDSVTPGSRLAVLEAMKMQHEILAAAAGVVTEVPVAAGTQVKAGDLLVSIDVEGGAA